MASDALPPEEAPYAYEGLDRVVHEKARLGMLTALASHQNGISFVELRRLCHLTDGNLARHLRVLEEAKLVLVKKGRRGGRSVSTVRMTAQGRKQFLAYLAELERVIRDARAHAADEGEESSAPSVQPGLAGS